MNAPRHLLRIQCIGYVARFLGKPVQRVILPAGAHLQTPGSQHNYGQLLRPFHCSAVCSTSRPSQTQLEKTVEDETLNKDKSLVTHDDLFERAARDSKTKADFNRVVDVFSKKDIRRRGHVEFIYAALKKMPEFGVERDITVYNKLLDVFPKEVLVPRNFIQRMFNHYPRQQECGVQLLEQMEIYGLMPNVETKVLLAQIFGEKSHPMRKYQRIMYWFPKFKHANPFPVPHVLSSDPVELARFSLTRIADDLEMIGPEQSLFYPQRVELDLERDMGDDFSFSVDDVEEGPVYAMCMAGQGDQATLSQWISGLQETCPILGQIPTVFRLDSGPRELQTSSGAQQTPEQEVETEQIIEEEPLLSQRVKQ